MKIFIPLVILLITTSSLSAQLSKHQKKVAGYELINSLYNEIVGNTGDTQFYKSYFLINKSIEVDSLYIYSNGIRAEALKYISETEVTGMMQRLMIPGKNWNYCKIKFSKRMSLNKNDKWGERSEKSQSRISRRLARINNQKHPGKYSYEERRMMAKYYCPILSYSNFAFNSSGEYALFYYQGRGLSNCYYFCHFSGNRFDKILFSVCKNDNLL
ncbi:MAG TPA: hypothetical protein DCQ93_03865 [Bacteroidetes bacterium]|nr:hypothetical protein [Bacteroidota bacterium]